MNPGDQEKYLLLNDYNLKSDFIFGIRPVIEAINAGKQVEKILFRKDLQGELYKGLLSLARENKILYQFVPLERLNRITRKNHQGVVAFISPIEYTSLEQLIPLLFEKGQSPFIIMLDGITDVRNFGAIARTAECAGAHAIVLAAKGSAQINADAMKVSAGALHSLPVCKVDDLAKAVKFMKESGLEVVAASEKATEAHFSFDYTKPLVIIMGAEDTGVSPVLLRNADNLVRIPLLGSIESLNVSAAAAVLMYEVVRQRS